MLRCNVDWSARRRTLQHVVQLMQKTKSCCAAASDVCNVVLGCNDLQVWFGFRLHMKVVLKPCVRKSIDCGAYGCGG